MAPCSPSSVAVTIRLVCHSFSDGRTLGEKEGKA
jgi:hypothetical protein